ncbi:hypothetical protein KY285_010609 [Solanum tuberosum]|nr:hypothetical protein KY285_010609 [Solanum tuberosum]
MMSFQWDFQVECPLPGVLSTRLTLCRASRWPIKPAYQSNPEYIKELQRKDEKLLNKVYVRESTSPCTVPILLTSKKDGAWCMRVDCWAINKIIVRYCHPIPRLDDMIDELNSYYVYSKMSHLSPCHKCDDASNTTFLFDENVVKLFEKPLWCDDTLYKDGNLFCEDDSTFIGKGGVNMKRDAYVLTVTSSLCVPRPRMSYVSLVSRVESKVGNPFIEVHLGKSANLIEGGTFDPSSWIAFQVDPHSELNCGICMGMLGQNDRHNVGEIVYTFPYDGQPFLRVYNPLKEPTLCMGKDSFLHPFVTLILSMILLMVHLMGVGDIVKRSGRINRANESLLDSMLCNPFPFDLGVSFKCVECGSNTFCHSYDSYLVLLLDAMYLNELSSTLDGVLIWVNITYAFALRYEGVRAT